MNCTPMVPYPLDNFVNERVLAFGKQAAPGSILGVGQDRRHRDATAARSPPRKIRPRASIPLGRPNPMQVVGAGDRKYPASRFSSAELNIVDARCRPKTHINSYVRSKVGAMSQLSRPLALSARLDRGQTEIPKRQGQEGQRDSYSLHQRDQRRIQPILHRNDSAADLRTRRRLNVLPLPPH